LKHHAQPEILTDLIEVFFLEVLLRQMLPWQIRLTALQPPLAATATAVRPKPK
jgi:hypothetical protein